MRVLFLENVVNVWHKWDIKDVSDWYAANFLLPKNLAKRLTPQEEQKIKQELKNKEKKRIELIENKQDIVSRLNLKEFDFSLKTGSNGKVFWSIWEKDIITKIKKEFSIELQKKHIDMQEWHIKKIGQSYVYIKLSPDNIAKIIINVK